MVTKDIIDALVAGFGPLGAALILAAVMLWNGYRSAKKAEPPAPPAEPGMPPADKLWFITEVRDPILTKIQQSVSRHHD